MKYRADIQGLRAIAVIFVLLFHLNRGLLPGGFIGVDIFFVISGFLITSIIVKSKERKSFSFVDFYGSRIKRIVPAFYVLLLIVTVAVIFLFIGSDLDQYKHCLKNAIFFNSNNYFKHIDTYFGAKANELPLLHTWTLAIEMQFYLLLPLVVILLPKKYLLSTIVLIFVLLVIYTQYNLDVLHNKSDMYFSLLARAGEFMVGSVVSLTKPRRNRDASVIQSVGLLVLIVSGFIISETSDFPGLVSMFPCAGTALLIYYDKGLITRLLSLKPMVFIGEISYSIYLWHWPIFALIRYRLQSYNIPVNISIPAIILILILSWSSYNFIEQKFRKLDQKKMAISFAVSVCFLVGLDYAAPVINSRLYNLPTDFVTPLGLGMVSHSKRYVKDTMRGAEKSNDTLLLLGDSHGLFLNVFLDEIGKKDSFSFHSVTNDTYPTIWGIDSGDIQNNADLNKYLKLSAIAKSFTGQSKIIVFTRYWRSPIPSFYNAFKSFLDSLDPDQYLILISDVPRLNKNPVRLTKSIIEQPESSEIKPIIDPTPIKIVSLLKQYKNVYYLDLSGSLAFANAPYFNDTLMYYDANHLNVYGAKKYAQFSYSKFVNILNEIREKIRSK